MVHDNKNKIMKRILWIDLLRGICMLCVLLFHTEMYYCGNAIIPYCMYVVNALCIFFVLSGYLLFNENNVQHKLHSIFRKLILPYFIFTALIGVFKSLFTDLSFTDCILKIILGQASWFVAALIVAELVFLVLLHISKRRECILFPLSLLSFAVGLKLSGTEAVNIWNLDSAFVAVFLLYLGWSYHKNEIFLNNRNTSIINIILFVVLVILKIYEQKKGIENGIGSVNIESLPIFIIDTLISVLLLINISKKIESYYNKICFLHYIQWTGSHSIVYYFFCGAVPRVMSTIMISLGFVYNGNYLLVIFTFLLVYIIISLITFIVYQYFPFTIGIQ